MKWRQKLPKHFIQHIPWLNISEVRNKRLTKIMKIVQCEDNMKTNLVHPHQCIKLWLIFRCNIVHILGDLYACITEKWKMKKIPCDNSSFTKRPEGLLTIMKLKYHNKNNEHYNEKHVLHILMALHNNNDNKNKPLCILS